MSICKTIIYCVLLSICILSSVNVFKEFSTEYEEKTVKHIVCSGETIWSIADKYYDLNKNGMCFEEFKYQVGEDNSRYQNSKRMLQIGDELTIKYYIPKV